jgi:amino acid permease
MVILVIYTIFYLSIHSTIEEIFASEDIMLTIYWTSLILLIVYLSLKWGKKKKHVDSINEYFQNRFLLLNEIPLNYKEQKKHNTKRERPRRSYV